MIHLSKYKFMKRTLDSKKKTENNMKKMTNWKKIFAIHIMEKGLILLRDKWFFNEEGKVGNLTEKCAKTQSNTSQNQMHKRPLIIWNKPFHTQLMKIHNDRSLLGVCVCVGGCTLAGSNKTSCALILWPSNLSTGI